MTDEQIDGLIRPTIEGIKDVLTGDYRKTLLFLGGKHMTEESIGDLDPYIQAMMLEPRLFGDKFIRQKTLRMIQKRIDDAKIGVIDVHGNYSILCGDPYALCQSIFGLEVTGLLKRGEIYNQYWSDRGVPEVVCFRAPMSCPNNILRRKVARTDDIAYWYRYIHTCTLFNSFDNGVAALNGADRLRSLTAAMA